MDYLRRGGDDARGLGIHLFVVLPRRRSALGDGCDHCSDATAIAGYGCAPLGPVGDTQVFWWAILITTSRFIWCVVPVI